MTNTINTNNINFRESGIYSETFYQTHKNIFDFEEKGYIKYEQYEKLIEDNNSFQDEILEYINENELIYSKKYFKQEKLKDFYKNNE